MQWDVVGGSLVSVDIIEETVILSAVSRLEEGEGGSLTLIGENACSTFGVMIDILPASGCAFISISGEGLTILAELLPTVVKFPP